MIRNFKPLGAVLAAVIAMTAMTASASAQQGLLTTEDGTAVTLNMTPIPNTTNELIVSQGIECHNSVFKGHKYDATPHQSIPSKATTFTVTFLYQFPCAGLPATGTSSGCDYVFHIGTTLGPNRYSHTMDLACPPEKNIEVHLYTGSAHALKLCTYIIKPQLGLTGVSLTTDTESGDLLLEGELLLDGQLSGLCGGKTFTAVHHMNFTVTGTGKGEFALDLAISDS